ncbi:MAG TPA: hypothetical protein VD913_00345 [bacterium]|nr:hypothetical protein [bacterium]
MRKLLTFFIFLSVASPLFAAVDGQTDHGPLTRIAIVEGRGLTNLLALPLVDLPRTVGSEVRMHHWLWPVSVIPRIATHLVIRVTSSFYDIAVYPWKAPFSNDISPITEPMGLPEYPWQGWED